VKGFQLMLDVIIFKLLQLIILGIFVAYISDFRRKKGMVPLIGEKWTLLLKASYLVPLAAYIFVLFTANNVLFYDLIALGITLLGTIVVVKAKKDLSVHHTWVGYFNSTSKFTTNGIYAYIRHPIYTGIYIFVIGSLFTILPHMNIFSYITLAIAAIISIIYIMGFLAFLANKETKALLRKHGKSFQYYKEKVHPFLPLRKYSLTKCR